MIRHHFDNISSLGQKADDARMKLATAKKRARDDGVDVQALERVRRAQRQDIGKTHEEIETFHRYSNIMGLQKQLDLFAARLASEAEGDGAPTEAA